MVSSNLWTSIDSMLGDAFMMIPKKVFSGLPPIKKSYIFTIFQ